MLSTISTISHSLATFISSDVPPRDIVSTPSTINNNTTVSNSLFQYLQRHSPDGLKYFRLYERKLLSAHEEKARLRFLNQCLDECVLPRSIPRGENLLQAAFPQQDRIALQERIVLQRRGLGSRFHDVRLARNAYKCLLPPRIVSLV